MCKPGGSKKQTPEEKKGPQQKIAPEEDLDAVLILKNPFLRKLDKERRIQALADEYDPMGG